MSITISVFLFVFILQEWTRFTNNRRPGKKRLGSQAKTMFKIEESLKFLKIQTISYLEMDLSIKRLDCSLSSCFTHSRSLIIVTSFVEWLLGCAHVHWLNIWTCGFGCINMHAKYNIELSFGYERI